jgi:hypothetical protein
MFDGGHDDAETESASAASVEVFEVDGLDGEM